MAHQQLPEQAQQLPEQTTAAAHHHAVGGGTAGGASPPPAPAPARRGRARGATAAAAVTRDVTTTAVTTSSAPPRDRTAAGTTGSNTVASGKAAPGGGPAHGGTIGTVAISAGGAFTAYLQQQATAFLRGLSLRGESETEADALLRGSARRIAGVLHTYAPLADPGWAEPLRAELAWLSATLGREPQYATRLARLVDALRRLSAAGTPEAVLSAALPLPSDGPPAEVAAAGGGAAPLALGAARAAALLERQLTLARTRAHSATLQAMGSSRFHGLADSIAVLASEVPLTPGAAQPAHEVLPALAGQAYQRLCDAADALPLHRAALPYNAEAVQAALGAELTADLQDAPWHQVRILLRLARYAAEVPGAEPRADERLGDAATLLQRHREASESAAAVASAARTPRIAPATAYALGVLHADQRHEVEAARFAFSRLWQTQGQDANAAPAPGVRTE
ncbi:CHAD domain-containing protein [Actinacidiphila acididurans]|uniref:CHAD domain-containing protein n=1 Tax=Actinacidiphila acididurans TaxID=2784346 RepID=UPI0035581FFE